MLPDFKVQLYGTEPAEEHGLLYPYLCISLADVLMPRHSNKITPTTAMVSRKRVLVKNTHTALVGGNCALADFHVMPPLGSSMMSASGGPVHHP